MEIAMPPPHPAIRSTSRCAFTLIELLVVIAIIGVLLALLLSAVQMARESAARAQCQNNLKQIALAAHSYQDANQSLPPGYDKQQIGVLVYLLPFLEQSAVFATFNGGRQPLAGTPSSAFTDSGNYTGYTFPAGDPYTPYWWLLPPETDTTTLPAPTSAYPTEQNITVLNCPSSRQRSDFATVLLASDYLSPTVSGLYPGYTGVYDVVACLPTNQVVGITNYQGIASIHDAWAWGTPNYGSTYRTLLEYGVGVNLARCADGTSNTLLFGECNGWPISSFDSFWGGTRPPGFPVSGNVGVAWTSGVRWINFGLYNTSNQADYSPGGPFHYANSTGINKISYGPFNSAHVGGMINFAFADGSVRPVDPNIDFLMYCALAGYMDGVEATNP
jgi:prepilin-type N-terminal cleavage/methylation domain-containing protein/prepilin-type processing-associated H-X9-DG protein